MQGYHETGTFLVDTVLPLGWKPFAYDPTTHTVVCRRWHRLDELSEHPEREQANQEGNSP